MCSKVRAAQGKRRKKKESSSDPFPAAVYYKDHAPVVTNLFTDLSTGVVLHKLLVALFAGRGAKIPQINENPKSAVTCHVVPLGWRFRLTFFFSLLQCDRSIWTM